MTVVRLVEAREDGSAVLAFDEHELLFNQQTRLDLAPPKQPQEIIEEGVTKITMLLSSTYNAEYTPAGQKVKWFRDELGQLWCKFTTAPPINTNVIDRVWPADRVVCVEYRKGDA